MSIVVIKILYLASLGVAAGEEAPAYPAYRPVGIRQSVVPSFHPWLEDNRYGE
jgi:hypothetical protein